MRAADGERAWSAAGRPLADLLYWLANLGDPAVNVFPLYQVISAALVALAAVLLARLLGVRQPALVAVATFPLGAQPYFLQNYSYAFDALTMSAGLLSAVAAAYWICSQGGGRPIIFGSLALFAALTLYQPALTAYMLIAVTVPLLNQAEDRNRQLISAVAVGGIAVLIYHYAVPISNSYHANKLVLLQWSSFVPSIVHNLEEYWHLLMAHWQGSFVGWNIALIFFLSIILSAVPIANRKNSSKKIQFETIYSPVALVFCVGLSYGALLLMEKPIYVPRVFIGVGVAITLMNLVIVRQVSILRCKWIRGFQWILVIPVYSLAYAFLNVSFAYGNASAAQKDFDLGFYTRLIHDLGVLDPHQEADTIGFIGAGPKSPTLLNSEKKFPILGSLVKSHVNNNFYWGSYQLRHYGIDLKQAVVAKAMREQITQGELKPAIDRRDYEIFLLDHAMVVNFAVR